MLIDTNILIAYLKGEDKVVIHLSKWKSHGMLFYISTINLAEILSFPKWSDKVRLDIGKFLEKEFGVISFDSQIAILAAQIRSKKKIKLPDAGIAATALHLRVPIVTRNLKDFKKITNLKIVSL